MKTSTAEMLDMSSRPELYLKIQFLRIHAQTEM